MRSSDYATGILQLRQERVDGLHLVGRFVRFASCCASVALERMAQLAANRAQTYLDIASGPFYGFHRPGVKPVEGLIRNWWRQGMGSAKAHYDAPLCHTW